MRLRPGMNLAMRSAREPWRKNKSAVRRTQESGLRENRQSTDSTAPPRDRPMKNQMRSPRRQARIEIPSTGKNLSSPSAGHGPRGEQQGGRRNRQADLFPEHPGEQNAVAVLDEKMNQVLQNSLRRKRLHRKCGPQSHPVQKRPSSRSRRSGGPHDLCICFKARRVKDHLGKGDPDSARNQARYTDGEREKIMDLAAQG